MKISELTTGQGNVDAGGTIKEVGEPRSFNRFGRELKVVTVILEDDSGTIKLTLWNDDADKFKAGDVVKITNGYVNEFQGESQLTAGKFGKIEKAGESEASELSEESEASESGGEPEEQAELSDEAAETVAEDAAEDSAVQEAVKEEAPEDASEEAVEEASEALEEAEEAKEETEEEK